jgi:hypothetical protein
MPAHLKSFMRNSDVYKKKKCLFWLLKNGMLHKQTLNAYADRNRVIGNLVSKKECPTLTKNTDVD